MSLFIILKFIHVLSAIVAVGTNLTYGVLLANAARQPEHLVYTLKSIRVLDRRLANPGYTSLLITGLWMAYTVRYRLATPWILSALVLYLAILVLAIAVYAPAFRRQIRLAEDEGLESSAYRAAARRANLLGGLVTVLAVVIVLLMVTKPPLWGG